MSETRWQKGVLVRSLQGFRRDSERIVPAEFLYGRKIRPCRKRRGNLIGKIRKMTGNPQKKPACQKILSHGSVFGESAFGFRKNHRTGLQKAEQETIPRPPEELLSGMRQRSENHRSRILGFRMPVLHTAMAGRRDGGIERKIRERHRSDFQTGQSRETPVSG